LAMICLGLRHGGYCTETDGALENGAAAHFFGSSLVSTLGKLPSSSKSPEMSMVHTATVELFRLLDL
jgi:hypothetical protein